MTLNRKKHVYISKKKTQAENRRKGAGTMKGTGRTIVRGILGAAGVVCLLALAAWIGVSLSAALLCM